MQTIVINSQKGGSGKSTLCSHLSVAAEQAGDGPAFMIDTDPQGTLTMWHTLREAEIPERLEVSYEEIEDGLTRLDRRGVSYCFIDTAPSRAEEIEKLLSHADLVIVPIRPSPADLWAASATVEILKRDGIPFLFVLYQVKANASITAQAAASLSHHGPVAQTFIGDRVPYAAALTDGRTAMELNPNGPAAVEIKALWKNIKACIHANMEAGKHNNMKTSLKVKQHG